MKKLFLILFLFGSFGSFSQDFYPFAKTTSTVITAGGIAKGKFVFIGDTVPFAYKSTAKIAYGTILRTAINAGNLIPDTAASGGGSTYDTTYLYMVLDSLLRMIDTAYLAARTDSIKPLYDTIAKHLDTLQAHNDRLKAVETGGATMVYPGEGIPQSTGAAWGTSFVNDGRAPKLNRIDVPSEVVASAINDGATLYSAFPSMLQSPSGKLFLFYRKAETHVASGDWGTCIMRKSSDQGKTWTAADTAIQATNKDVRCEASGISATGRIILGYSEYDLDGGGNLNGKWTYSDDEGDTWATPGTLPKNCRPFGKIIEIGGGQLMMSSYITWGSPVKYNVHVRKSSDNGVTWGDTIMISSSTSVKNGEPCLQYLGGGYILAMCRIQAGGTTFNQYLSADNGDTWTLQGPTTFDAWDATVGTVANLQTYKGTDGKRMVACYYTNRFATRLRVVYGSASDLITYGVAGWKTSSRRDIATMYAIYTGGYPSVVHYNDSPFGIGVYYDETAPSNASAVLRFFTQVGDVGSNLSQEKVWIPVVGAYASTVTFTMTGNQSDADKIYGSLIRWESSGGAIRYGMIANATVSGNTITATCYGTAAMAANDKNYYVAPSLKARLWERRITVPGILIADASNPQGMWYWGNANDTLAIFNVNGYLLTAAATACTFNLYYTTTALFSSALDFGNAASILNQTPTAVTLVPPSVNMTLRILSNNTGAANFQCRYFAVPTRIFWGL